MLGSLSPSAVYVIDTSEGLILVDSGLDDDAGVLKAEMAKLGLEWKRVKAILLTHVHGDRSGGADALHRATGAKVYAGEGDAVALHAGQPREAFFSTFYMPGHVPHPTGVDVVLKGGETITFGDVRIQALATPGHTPGSMCYLMEGGNLRALFAGDVIMMLRGDDQPRTELGKPLGTYSAYRRRATGARFASLHFAPATRPSGDFVRVGRHHVIRWHTSNSDRHVKIVRFARRMTRSLPARVPGRRGFATLLGLVLLLLCCQEARS